MKLKQRLTIAVFFLACLLLLSLLFVFSLNNFLEIASAKGLGKETLIQLPEWMRPLYEGLPSFTTLICYCLFTFSAFLFLKEKRPKYKVISVISFVLLFVVFLLFF